MPVSVALVTDRVQHLLTRYLSARLSLEVNCGSSLLTLTVWPASGEPSFNTSTVNALSTGWFRTAESSVQVAVTTNGLAAAC